MALDFSFDFPGLRRMLKLEGGREEEQMMTGQIGKYEINLVPDVKLKMIKLQKIRNLVFFVCLTVSTVALVTIVILGGIKGAQDLLISGQDARLKVMSDKIMGYDELKEFLTIQDQLGKIKEIEDNKKVLSRVFSLLSVILPKGADTISLSELSVNLDNSTLSFDAQANAGVAPLIDYRVLESFKKGVGLMKYDYGRYVDASGNEIPTRCLVEADEKGNLLVENGNIYAIWQRGRKGCDPGRTDSFLSEKTEKKEGKTTTEESKELIPDERVWRTPQFKDWSSGKEVKTVDEEKVKSLSGGVNAGKTVVSYTYNPMMERDGTITGIPHFVSKCISYNGIDTGNEVKWSAENSCEMAPQGMVVNDSSNGRDSGGNLVLRFSAVINLNQNIFAFKNKHVMAIGPNGQNVTDSYVQIEGMFAERAKDCLANDAACKNTQNTGGDA